ncbi:hypothetical protein J3F83DRAFT_750924 [Trichoderma novae-zelandiae]
MLMCCCAFSSSSFFPIIFVPLPIITQAATWGSHHIRPSTPPQPTGLGFLAILYCSWNNARVCTIAVVYSYIHVSLPAVQFCRNRNQNFMSV